MADTVSHPIARRIMRSLRAAGFRMRRGDPCLLDDGDTSVMFAEHEDGRALKVTVEARPHDQLQVRDPKS